MPRTPTVSNDDLLDSLTVLFRTVGYEAASMTRIAQATGLEKSSLYHRFPDGKQQMAAEVVGQVAETFANDILSSAFDLDIPLTKRIERIARNLRSFYENGTLPCVLEALSVEGVNDAVTGDLEAAANGWIEVFAALAIEAGIAKRESRQRAEDAIANIEGALILARVTGNTAPFERALKALPRTLTEPQTQTQGK